MKVVQTPGSPGSHRKILQLPNLDLQYFTMHESESLT